MKFALKTAAAFWLLCAGLLAGTPPKSNILVILTDDPREEKEEEAEVFAEMGAILKKHVQRDGGVARQPPESKP